MMPALRFGAFRPEDRSHFQPLPPKTKAAVAKPDPPPKPVSKKPALSDRALLRALEAAAAGDPQGTRLWALEWKLKARVMDLNERAQKPRLTWGDHLRSWQDAWAARRLFRSVATSKVYTPAPWLMGHLGRLAQHYRIDALVYF